MEPPNDAKPSARNIHDAKIRDMQLGVWALRIAGTSSFQGPQKLWADVQEIAPFVWRLARDIYFTTPYYSTIYLLCQLSDGLEDLVLLALSDKLLKTVRLRVAYILSIS